MSPSSDTATTSPIAPQTASQSTAIGTPAAAAATAAADEKAQSEGNFELSVTLPANLHARPAGKLAQTAAGFSSVIRLEYAGRSINPTGVLAVMSLGATVGTTVTLRAEGPDAEQAVQALADVLANAE
jgi:phosphotransferase system HPr (HPr) family protein